LGPDVHEGGRGTKNAEVPRPNNPDPNLVSASALLGTTSLPHLPPKGNANAA
jgi:hypothetical protein